MKRGVAAKGCLMSPHHRLPSGALATWCSLLHDVAALARARLPHTAKEHNRTTPLNASAVTLRVIENIANERLSRQIPDLYVRLVDPDDDGGNVTSALGEIRMWLVPPIYAEDGSSRTLELIVRVGNPLVRNSGKFKGGLDYVDEVVETLNGFEYDAGKKWSVRKTSYWKRIGTIHWYEIRCVSIEQ